MAVDQLLLHTLCGAPLARWFVSQKQWGRAGYLACGVLAVALCVLEWSRPQSNFYDALGVSTYADRWEITTAYRKTSLKYHPDTNDSPDAEEQFFRLKRVQETLLSDTSRTNYNKFGDYQDVNFENEGAMLVMTLSVVAYVLAFVLAYLVTFPREFQSARQILILYLCGAFCFELHCRFVAPDIQLGAADAALAARANPIMYTLWNSLLPFERVQLLRRLVPAVLVLSMAVSSYTFEDNQEVLRFLLQGILQSNAQIVAKLTELDAQSANFAAPGGAQSTAAKKAVAERVKANAIQPAALSAMQEGVSMTKLQTAVGTDAMPTTTMPSAAGGGDGATQRGKAKAAAGGAAAAGTQSGSQATMQEFTGTLSAEQQRLFGQLLDAQSRQGGQQAQQQKGGMNMFQLAILGYVVLSYGPQLLGFFTGGSGK